MYSNEMRYNEVKLSRYLQQLPAESLYYYCSKALNSRRLRGYLPYLWWSTTWAMGLRKQCKMLEDIFEIFTLNKFLKTAKYHQKQFFSIFRPSQVTLALPRKAILKKRCPSVRLLFQMTCFSYRKYNWW